MDILGNLLDLDQAISLKDKIPLNNKYIYVLDRSPYFDIFNLTDDLM